MFDYSPPKLGLNRSEQRLLSCALPGATDEHLAATLGISLPTVKKLWVSIYRQVEVCLPELIPDPPQSVIPASGRGREKRCLLLGYLREHPEELRPFFASCAAFWISSVASASPRHTICRVRILNLGCFCAITP
jgi:hypothetical protein